MILHRHLYYQNIFLNMQEAKKQKQNLKFRKTPTGIAGLDEITQGGLPENRTTLIAGSVGCGKTMIALEFLIKGATEFNEPGIFLAFEESEEELAINAASLGYDVNSLIKKKQIYLEHVAIDYTEIIDTGDFNLEGLFIRLEQAIDRIGAKRVVIDSLNSIFYGLKYEILRGEIRRLFSWLKKKKVTSIITTETGENSHTQPSLEEFIADCVIILNNRVTNQVTTRRLMILKYRGSVHGINEYPFSISKKGINVFPVIAEIQDVQLSAERLSSGIKGFDEMLGGKGFYQGSSILVSGSAGTGKTSITVSIVNAFCSNEKRCLFCAFEESPRQISRNMSSIGLDLEPYLKSGYLQFYFYRPTLQDLELHFLKIQTIIEEYNPRLVILDPVTNIMKEDINTEIRYMLVKFIDFLKSKQITVLLTAAITLESITSNPSDEGISSMVDTWLLVRDIEKNGERNRGIYVLKSRGMQHSSQLREFLITDNGIELIPVFVINGEVLTGSTKNEYDHKQKTKRVLRNNEIQRNKREIERQRKVMEAEVTRLKAQFESAKEGLSKTQEEERILEAMHVKNPEELMNRGSDDEEKKKNKTK